MARARGTPARLRLGAAAGPDRVELHRALRVAVAIPVVIALVVHGLGLPAAGVYAGFACLSLLTSADFGGAMALRVGAYLAAGLGGALAIVLGHLVAPQPAAAALAGVVVGAGLAFVTVLRGYIGSGAASVQLGFILAATAGPGAVLSTQILGWLVGSLAATLAAVLLWPRPAISQLQLAVAATLEIAADALCARWITCQRRSEQADLVASHAALRRRLAGRFTRPGGATSRERALVELVDEIGRLRSLLAWRADEPEPGNPIDRALAEATQGLLRSSAAALAGRGPAPDPQAVARAREEQFSRSVELVSTSLATGDAATGLAPVASTFPLRLCAISVQFVASDTRRALSLPGQEVRSAEGVALPGTIWETGPTAMLAANTNVRSPWFRNGIRTGLGLGLAIFVALSLGQHSAFWVVLGTLSVLRFDALGTGRTAAQAVLGTFAGCLAGAGLVGLVGPHSPALWIVLPVVAFVAAYSPSRTTFLLGQAAFSMFLIVLVAVSSGQGPWDTGLVRLTDIVLGAAVSVVVAVLMWPRGIRALVHGTLADALARAADYSAATTDQLAAGLAGSPDPAWRANSERVRRTAIQAAALADETVDLAVTAHAPAPASAARWARVAGVSHHLIEAADVMAALGQPPPRGPGAGDVGMAMVELSHGTVGALGLLARSLGTQAHRRWHQLDAEIPPLPASREVADARVLNLRAKLAASLEVWPASPDSASDAVRLIWSAQWQEYLAWSAAVATTAI